MSYKLLKPYNQNLYNEFLIKHQNLSGLTIQETDSALYALEPWEKLNGDEVLDNTEEYKAEQAEKEKQSRILKIKQQLNELDTKRIRAMCEPSVCENDPEKTWLDFYNEQAQALRAELQELEERTENDSNINE